MSTKLTIGYLTGSAKVIKNHLNSDEIEWREGRSVQQMFFQPYESKEEFIYCARHTFAPILTIGLAILDPTVMVTTPAIIGGVCAGLAIMSAISDVCGNEQIASDLLNMAISVIQDLCQALIDLVVLPLSALVMLTRGVSTGLQAAGIGREHEYMMRSSFPTAA